MSYTVLHLDNPEQSFVLGDHVIYVNPPGSDEEPSLGVVYAMGNAAWLEAYLSGIVIVEGVSITPLFDPGDDHVIILQHADSSYHSYVASGGVFTYDSDTWLADHTLAAIPAPETIFYERMLLVFSDGIGYTAETVASTRTNQLYVIVNTGGSNYLPIIIAHTNVTGDDVELPPQSINDLTDVNTVSDPPAVNDLLQWDGSNWVPVTILGFGIDDDDGQPQSGSFSFAYTRIAQADFGPIGTLTPGVGITGMSALYGEGLVFLINHTSDSTWHAYVCNGDTTATHDATWLTSRAVTVEDDPFEVAPGALLVVMVDQFIGPPEPHSYTYLIINDDGDIVMIPVGDGVGDSVDLSSYATKALSTTFVEHGATSGTARPTGWGRVVWFGTVEPTNADDLDEWIDTTP